MNRSRTSSGARCRRAELVAALCTVVLAACAGPPPFAPDGTCTVRSVTDGDSLVCRDGRRVRLLSIDAPELGQRPWGDQAREALASAAPPGTRLGVEHDVERRDGFGRVLAYLYTSETSLNELIARRGYAVALIVEPNGRHAARIRAAVTAARRAGAGLWGVWGFACRPADFRAGRCG